MVVVGHSLSLLPLAKYDSIAASSGALFTARFPNSTKERVDAGLVAQRTEHPRYFHGARDRDKRERNRQLIPDDAVVASATQAVPPTGQYVRGDKQRNREIAHARQPGVGQARIDATGSDHAVSEATAEVPLRRPALISMHDPRAWLEEQAPTAAQDGFGLQPAAERSDVGRKRMRQEGGAPVEGVVVRDVPGRAGVANVHVGSVDCSHGAVDQTVG